MQGDTLDAICARYYGRTEGVVETVLQANPLSELGVILPHGTAIELPETDSAPENRDGESMGLNMENHDVCRLLAGRGSGVFRGDVTRKTGARYVGGGCAIFTALTNYWFKRKTHRYLISLGLDKGAIRELNH